MIEVLEFIWNWLHWIVFGVGCLTLLTMFYALFVARYDNRQMTDEEIMKERSKGEGM